MRKGKKELTILIVTVVVLVVVSIVLTTYAWFLSSYSHEYAFELKSDSPIIIKYESDLVFGSEVAAENVMVPAMAKTLVGSEQGAMDPIDVFDTTLVDRAAHAVKITADGAYWAGEVSVQDPKNGLFLPKIYAYTSAFLESEELEDHLEDFSNVAEITEENLLALLSSEQSAYASSPTQRMIARNDLVAKGEIDAFILLEYLGETMLYFDGSLYSVGVSTGADLTLPASVESNDELRHWHLLTAGVDTYENTDYAITDGTHLRMMPNTTITMTLYLFMAKADEELDPEINGETISFFVALTIQEE